MIHILALIHARADDLKGLRAYETEAISILTEHGGKLLSAFKPKGQGQSEVPDEIHLIAFPSEEAFQAYRDDPRVKALAQFRSQAISKTEIYISDEMVNYAAQS